MHKQQKLTTRFKLFLFLLGLRRSRKTCFFLTGNAISSYSAWIISTKDDFLAPVTARLLKRIVVVFLLCQHKPPPAALIIMRISAMTCFFSFFLLNPKYVAFNICEQQSDACQPEATLLPIGLSAWSPRPFFSWSPEPTETQTLVWCSWSELLGRNWKRKIWGSMSEQERRKLSTLSRFLISNLRIFQLEEKLIRREL